MAVDKIDVKGDSRISHEYANLNGKRYHYLLGKPQGECRGTIFLIHGWPDISMGWRYQIPLLLELGLRVVVPDMLGYGGSDAPKVPPEDLALYSMKRAAHDIKELANQLDAPQIILGGHDWGGVVIWRVCLWFPDFVTRNVFSVCTPYTPPRHGDFVSLEDQVNTMLPNFRYQLQLASGEPQERVQDRESLKKFLSGMYGGKGPDGEVVFTTEKGILFDNIDKIGPSPLLSEDETNYYADQYSRSKLECLNWYKMTRINYDEELSLTKSTIDIPALFVCATNDAALPPWMSQSMGKFMPQLTRRDIKAGHWVLWQAPSEVNSNIKEWLEGTYFKDYKGKL